MANGIKVVLPASLSASIKPLNLGNYTGTLKSTGDTNTLKTGKAIDEIQQMVNRLAQAAQATGSITIPSVINIQEVLLSQNTQIIPKFQPTAGEMLVVFVTQDLTGGWTISWNNQFRNAVVSADQDAGVMTQFFFIGRIDPSDTTKTVRWFYQGMSPEILDQEITLVADLEIEPEFQPSENKLLAVNITQDSTGGHAITWDPNSFDPTSSTVLLTGADTLTRMMFIGRLDSNLGPVSLAFPTGYSSGTGILIVPDTSIAAAVAPPFLVTLTDPASDVILVTLQVTAITDSTHFAVTPVGTDANAPLGSLMNFQPRWYLELNTATSGASNTFIFEQEVTLSADTIIVPVPLPIVNTLLTVFITQDGTGGHAVLWDSHFEPNTPVGIDADANSLSKMLFEGRLDPLTSTVLWFFLSGESDAGPVGAGLIGQTINFGLIDDTVQINAAKKYAMVLTKSTPGTGWYTVVTLPPNGSIAALFDILYSLDNGGTWTSIFPVGTTQIQIQPETTVPTDFVANPRVKTFTGFGNPVLPIGTILRADGLASGGAQDILLVLVLNPKLVAGAGPGLSFGGAGVFFIPVI